MHSRFWKLLSGAIAVVAFAGYRRRRQEAAALDRVVARFSQPAAVARKRRRKAGKNAATGTTVSE